MITDDEGEIQMKVLRMVMMRVMKDKNDAYDEDTTQQKMMETMKS